MNKFKFLLMLLVLGSIFFACFITINSFVFKDGRNINIVVPSKKFNILDKEVDEYIDSTKSKYNKLYNLASNSKVFNKNNFYLNIYYKEYDSDRFMSYIFFSEYFLGGAHPTHEIFTINYDKKNNKIINIDDIIKNEEVLKTISSESYKYFSKQKAFNNSDIKGMLKAGTKPIKDNFKYFVLTNDGIIFFFERYQIAPYYYGELEFFITYKNSKIKIY